MSHWCELCNGRNHIYFNSKGFVWYSGINDHVFVKLEDRTEHVYYTNSPVFKIELVKKKLSEL